jgi:hypothetical protein
MNARSLPFEQTDGRDNLANKLIGAGGSSDKIDRFKVKEIQLLQWSTDME